MKTYETVTEALKDLKLRGFITDFNIAFDKLICSENKICLNPGEFVITEVYRFEGATDPGDENVVYAIEAKDGAIKGVMSSAFGTYAESISNEMIRKLSMHK
jgi:hypothetical protein